MIIVFAGAGASRAVGDNYPTTIEFFQRLPDGITGDSLFELSKEYLEKEGPASIDIEQILWTLAELRDFSSKARDPKSVPGWFIDGNRMTRISGNSREDLQPFRNLAHNSTLRIDQLVSEIYKIVYELYSDLPSAAGLATNWTLLIRGLMALREPIDIVTTNYDLIIEEAIESLTAPVRSGRNPGVQPTLDTNLWDIADFSTASASSFGLLTKLHGSIDWVRGQNRIFVGTPLYQGQHKRHAIIYPGFKGRPEDDLFARLHLYFEQILSRADVVIFIGYAFRDEYINNLLRTRLDGRPKIIVLNPADALPDAPFTPGSYEHVKERFDDTGTTKVLESTREFFSTRPASARSAR